MEDYLRQYGLIFLLAVVSIVLPASVLLISKLSTFINARPSRPNPLKYSPYECGMEPEQGRWRRFNVRYYKFALLFLLFDVEVIFLFPRATPSSSLGSSAFLEVLFFSVIMMVGWAYEWKKGGMEWDESTPAISSKQRIN